MIEKFLFFFLIFLLGELLINSTFYNYLKRYFEIKDNTAHESTPFLWIPISIFKGILERFLMYFALTINLPHVLILFGAIKIGTRFEKNNKIKNDYFLIGNFSSVLFSIIYHFIYQYLAIRHL